MENYDYRGICEKDSGIAVVAKDGKFGYINSEGVEITPLKYNRARRFRGNTGMLKSGRKWGLVDKQGKEVIPPVFNDIIEYLGGNPVVIVRIGKKFGYLNVEAGELLTPVKYDKVEMWIQIWDFSTDDFRKDLARVRLDGKWGCVNLRGEEIIPVKYEDINISQLENPRIIAKFDGKWGFISENGKEITAFEYDGVEIFSNGRARIKKDGKYGFINSDGTVVIPIMYDDCESHFKSEGYDKDKRILPIRVKRDEKYGFVNISGKEIIAPEYEFALPFECFSDKLLAAVVQNGAVGFIDETGKTVIPCMYEPDFTTLGYRFFSDGFADVKLGGKWGVIDTKNDIIIPFLYDRFIANRYNIAFRSAIRKRRKVSVDRKGNEWSPKKNPTARTFKDYLHKVEWTEVAESFKTLLYQNEDEDMKIWEINFHNFRGKQFKPSNNIIGIYSGRRLAINANMYNPKSGRAFVFCDWAEILDMEVRIEDNLTLTDADIVAACIWEACDQVAGTEEKLNSFCKVLGEYAKLLTENVLKNERKLKLNDNVEI